MKTNRLIYGFNLLLAVFGPHFVSYSEETLILPQDHENTAGNRSIGIAAGSERIQFGYSSSLFSSIGSVEIALREIRLRVDPTGPAFSNITDMQVIFFTTSQDAEAPRNTPFSGNAPFVALPRTRLAWSGNPGLSSDAVIPLPNQFVYNRSLGNLVMDITIFDSGLQPMLFDAVDRSFDGLGAVVTGINSNTGVWSSTGLVTEFVFNPVPEPTAWALLGLAAGGILIVRRKNVLA
jgi:hypothetical protein